MALWHTQELLSCAEPAETGIRVQGVALFMETKREKLGISFCEPTSPKRMSISPGLAKLLNGSTFKTVMKKKHYDKLPEAIVLDHPCRIIRVKDKTIVLFASGSETSFAQACTVLNKLADEESVQKPRTISVDAIMLSRAKGVVADRVGCLKAAKCHEVIVYEDRGENLSFIKISQQDTISKPADIWGNMIPQLHKECGSERLHKKVLAARSGTPQAPRTKADMGQVCPPSFKSIKGRRDHLTNAFIEYKAIITAILKVNEDTCKGILDAYQWKSESLLKYRLKEAKAALYNCNTYQIIEGKADGEYMIAYNAIKGFIPLTKEKLIQTDDMCFQTPSSDPLVVLAQCTKFMIEDKILEMMEKISGLPELDAFWETWILPHVIWINGVPGCGKTTWLMEHFNADKDLIITTTEKSAEHLRGKLMQLLEEKMDNKVRTMSSVLVDGFLEGSRYSRLLVDKAMMHHFGAVVMAARLSGAEEIILIGDVNQLTYNKNNLFKMKYTKPSLLATITQELLCTHRCPMDVAYALNEIYPGMYSSNKIVHSFETKILSGATIPHTQANTLFLVFTEDEKDALIKQGCGTGEGSRVLTIGEAQALSSDTVVIIRSAMEKKPFHDNIPLAVVAVSRHTRKCVFYSNYIDEAINYFVGKGEGATTHTITEYNLQMAMRNGDNALVEDTIKVR